jgi:superfamily II DNA or RNA helicase
MITLRDYQIAAIDEARAAIRSKLNRILLISPTGSGKTIIGAELIRLSLAKGSNAWFLAHRKELIDQPSKLLDSLGIPHGIKMADHWRNQPWQPIQICSVQTLVRQIDKIKEIPSLIIVDECHHVMAETYKKILDKFPKTTVIGLTATPWRTDNKGLGDFFNKSILISTPRRLVDEGWIVPITGYVFKPIDADATESGVVRIASDPLIKWLDLANGKKTLIFSVDIDHSKEQISRFLATGIAAEHVDSNMSKEEREGIFERFKTKQTIVLSNVGICTEGWDDPGIECIVLTRRTEAVGLAIQMIGRGRRPVPCEQCKKINHWKDPVCLECGEPNKKRSIMVLDHAEIIMETLGGEPDGDRDWSLKSFATTLHHDLDSEPLRTCESCFALYEASLRACPMCGHENKKRIREKSIAHIDAETIPIEEIKKFAKASDVRKKEEYLKMLDYAHRKGFKRGYAAYRFNGRYGHWPDKSWSYNG